MHTIIQIDKLGIKNDVVNDILNEGKLNKNDYLQMQETSYIFFFEYGITNVQTNKQQTKCLRFHFPDS